MIQQSLGIFTTDSHLNIRSWDGWLIAVTGLPIEVVRDVNLLELFPDLHLRGLHHCFQNVLTYGKVEKLSPSTHSYLIPCMSSSQYFEYMPQKVIIAPLRDQKTIIGTIVTIEDMTVQLEHEHELSNLGKQLQPLEEKQPTERTEAQEIDKILQTLGDDDWKVRQVAIKRLVQCADQHATTILVSKIQHEHQDMSLLNSALKVLTEMTGDVVTPLMELLQLPDADLRGYVVLALGDQADRRAIPALIQALNDENPNVRYHSIESLGKLNAIEAIEVLVNIAQSGDFFLAFAALEALKRIREPRVIPDLISLLSDELLRESVIEILGELGDDAIVAPLATLLNQTQGTSLAIAQALARLHDHYEEFFDEGHHIAALVRDAITSQGMHHLLEALNFASESELRALALVLGWLEGEEVERALVQLLGKPSAQKEVVKAFMHHGSQITKLLIQQLDTSEMETRQAAIAVLERLGDKRAAPTLLRILTETDQEELMIATLNALAKLGELQTFETLLTFLGHPRLQIRQAAIAALNALNHPDNLKRLTLLLHDANPLVRESAVRILGYIGHPESLSYLLKSYQDQDEQVRQAVIESLPCFEDDRVMVLLGQALLKDTPQVRIAAARALAEVEHPIDYLREALSDPEAWVRYFVVRSLGLHKDLNSVEVLSHMARTEPARQVQLAAIEALGHLGHVKTVPLLASLSESEEEEIAQAGLEALGQVNHAEALVHLLAALQTPKPARKLKVLQALKPYHENEMIEVLQEFVAKEEDVQVLHSAIELLAHFGSFEAIQALMTLTAHPKRREACIKALAQLEESQLEWVASGLKHQHVGVRSAVVETLTRRKSIHTLKYLVPALSDKEATIRLAAVTAFGHTQIKGIEQKLLDLAHQDPNVAVRRAAQESLRYGGYSCSFIG